MYRRIRPISSTAIAPAARWRDSATAPLVVALLLTFATGDRLAAQSDEPIPDDVVRMVDEGMGEALDVRFRGGRTAREKHLLARAYANQAAGASQPTVRDRACERAAENYAAWIEMLARDATPGDIATTVTLAAAHIEYGRMLLNGPLAGLIDEYEITDGARGDRERMRALLRQAATEFSAGADAIKDIVADIDLHEEDLLATGQYDTALQARLDATLNLGWCAYYLGALEAEDAPRRREALTAAARHFRALLDSGESGITRASCHLGLGLAQRALGRYDAAEADFGRALDNEVSPTLTARIRYELARCQIMAGKFDEARTTLRPLVDKDPERLREEDRALLFYINLAHVWDAQSYLIEAGKLRSEAQNSVAAKAILQQAERRQETGLAKFKRLAARGGPWPALVQLYIASSVDVGTPVEQLSPSQLYYTAGMLMDENRLREAQRRLELALRHGELDAELTGDIAFRLGRCLYLLREERRAAEVFQRLAEKYRTHAKAPQAATLAFELWGRIADRTKAEADYLKLAATLENLVISFADHPRYDEARWFWPVALQRAGRPAQAAEEFAKVPPTSPHYDEARYLALVCRRQALRAERDELDAEAYTDRTRTLARDLLTFADDAAGREATASSARAARVSAAELLIAPGIDAPDAALAALATFDESAADSALLGRVLAVRLRAYRALRRFDEAARILSRFLDAAPPERVGPTLASLAAGMQEEVQRLLDAGQTAAARTLATESLATFDEFEKWVQRAAGRSSNLDYVQAGRAQMLYLAGRYDDAERLAAALLKRHPKSGTYRQLLARARTARLADDASADAVASARTAWAELLADPGLFRRAPEHYWEARYHWLRLTLELGDAADVEQAIVQERIWHADLGGEKWRGRFEALLRQARTTQGKPATADSQPTDGIDD
jgi:tetratricopeptide (TPR) repeat protein